MQTFCTKNTLAKLARCDVRTISREPNAMMFLGTKRVPIYLADVDPATGKPSVKQLYRRLAAQQPQLTHK
jgi:hypothetical protein